MFGYSVFYLRSGDRSLTIVTTVICYRGDVSPLVCKEAPDSSGNIYPDDVSSAREVACARRLRALNCSFSPSFARRTASVRM